jgi:hypothetical protein
VVMGEPQQHDTAGTSPQRYARICGRPVAARQGRGCREVGSPLRQYEATADGLDQRRQAREIIPKE